MLSILENTETNDHPLELWGSQSMMLTITTTVVFMVIVFINNYAL